MALGVSQGQRMRVTVSQIENVDTAAQGETLNVVPTTLARDLNALWKDQIISATPGTAREVEETIQRNPIREQVRTGVEDTNWEFTTAAWSPQMLELHDRKATFVMRPIRNTGAAGLASDYAGADNFSVTGIVYTEPPTIDATRSSEQNQATVTIQPISYTHKNGTVETLYRDIPNDHWRVHGKDRMRGLREAVL